MKKIIRLLGLILGVLLILMGIWLFIHPVKESALEILNAITFVLMVIIFVYYGITGKSRIIRIKK